jgi:alkylation response protein AidB-like acyl-CoA dehydrogenase
LTGRALFNEVFISDARVGDDALIGGLNRGWAVANTTLAFERAGLGAGGGSTASSVAQPGSVAGDLDKRAGDFLGRTAADGGPSMAGGTEQVLIRLARANGKAADPVLRQDLVRLHTYNEIGRMTNLRQKAARAAGVELPGAGNLAKLSMSKIVRLSRELGLQILGARGTLHAYNADDQAALNAITGDPVAGLVTEMALFSPGPSIYGGTDEVQKNIIGERVLGLPKEPNNDRTLPFRELPKNG